MTNDEKKAKKLAKKGYTYERIREACRKFSAYMVFSLKLQICEDVGIKVECKKWKPQHERFKNVFHDAFDKNIIPKLVDTIEGIKVNKYGRRCEEGEEVVA